jgi:thiosulfate/3-mercaptopyruvate sulfurtransferase
MPGLISTDWLESNRGEPDLVVLEVSFYQPDTAAWFRGHIAGSHYVWWKDLCWDEDERQFPPADVMAERLGQLGVTDDSTIVLVGDPIQFATYAYWVLAMSGFEHLCVVLDGGHATWEAEARPLTDAPPAISVPGRPVPRSPVGDALVGRDEVLDGLGSPGRALLDLRSTEEFEGLRVAPPTAPFDHGAERRGHIPGAVHLPHDRLLGGDGTFLGPDGVRAALESAGVGPEPEVVAYCRLSHRASLAWFAPTRIADRPNVRVYDGSWTEWGSMVGMPIERPAKNSS